MKKIAKFNKVSYQQYKKDAHLLQDHNDTIQLDYDDLALPIRASKGSAGYDFLSPFAFSLVPNETIMIPTGIRAEIETGWFLQMFPRSSLGFKYRLQLDNCVGIIDSDYFNAENEGHIFVKMTNATLEEKTLSIEKGKAFVQGIFVPFGLCYDDDNVNERIGGLGSSDN